MKTAKLFLAFVVLASGLFFIPLLPIQPLITANAQSCSVVDTFTASGTTGTGVTFPGTYNLIPGRRYTVTLTGTGVRSGDGWVFDPGYADDHGAWVSPFRDGGFRYGNGQRNMPSSYSSAHTYTVDMFGTGTPFTISTISYANATVTFSFDVSVCEEPQPYTTPSCTLVGQMNITQPSGSPTTGPVLTNGQTYDLYMAGEFINEGANLDDFYNRSADPAAYSSNNWSTQTFPYSTPFGNIGIASSSVINYTLITSTYQSSHLYHATIDGTGAAIQLYLGGGWFLYGGGFVVYICDPSITPTPGPTGTPSPTPTTLPGYARTCILLGNANSNFTAGNSWVYTSPDISTPSGASSGIRFPKAGATATLKLRLRAETQYKVETQYHLRQITEGLADLTYTVGLGVGQTKIFPVPILLSLATGQMGPQDFVAGEDGYYDLTLTWNGTDVEDDPVFVVDWVCVVQTAPTVPQPPITDNHDESVGRCESCERQTTGNLVEDFVITIGWLWCAIRQVLDCVIIQLLASLWNTIRNIGGFFVNVQRWAALGLASFGLWAITSALSVIYWAGGWIYNIIFPFLSWLDNVFRALSSLSNFLRALLGDSASTDRLIDFFQAMFRGVNDLIYVSTLLINGFQSGMTTTASIPAQYAPQCFDPGSILYYPCLGFYVAENTVLEGPVWMLIPFVMGVISWNVGFWALRQITKTFSQV